MRYSIVQKSEMRKYDFGHFLLSPEFFMEDKLKSWDALERNGARPADSYFLHVKDTVNAIDEKVICYDLTDGLTKFFDGGVEVTDIGSMKKIAQEGDFAISRMRSYLEEMGMVERRELKQLFSSEFLVFRPRTGKLSAQTFFALCMTKAVQTILKRGQYGTEHPRFYDFLLTALPVPDCLLSLDGNLKGTIQQALQVRASSRAAYSRAESLLLSSLGLAGWMPENRLWFVRDYAEVREAERFDADYFQPKYDEIINAVKACPGGWDALGNLVSARKCVEVGSAQYLGEGVPFVRVSDLGPFEIAREKYISESFYSRIREHQPERGEILFSKDATPGIAHYLREEPERMIPSGGILRLKSETDRVNNEYLTLALNSICTREQVNRDVGGSVILHWRPEQAMRTAIPILPRETQAEIRRMAVESFRLRAESGRLLERAKRAVEIAIEENEEAAREWLAKETGETA